LRKAVRTERDAADIAATIEQAEDRLANWPTDPQMNAALDDYTRLRDAIANTMSNAATIADLNASLPAVVEHADLGVYDGEPYGEFWLLETAVGLPHRIECSSPEACGSSPGDAARQT
jgi:hypothetical protein